MPVLHAIHRADQPWRLPFATHTLVEVVGKGIEVPEDGWTAAEFARQGTMLLRVMHRLAQLTQRKAMPHVAAASKQVMRRQMQRVVERVVGHRSAKRRDDISVDIMLAQPAWPMAAWKATGATRSIGPRRADHCRPEWAVCKATGW